MKSVWRSWFWNLFTMVGAFMFAISAAATLTSQASASAETPGLLAVMTVSGGVAALFGFGAIRALILGVRARSSGVVLRSMTRTTFIPWGEIQEIRVSPLTSGVAGQLGATTPVIVWTPPGRKQRSVDLSMLGGYGLTGSRPRLDERAAMGLNEHLARWRKEHSTSE